MLTFHRSNPVMPITQPEGHEISSPYLLTLPKALVGYLQNKQQWSRDLEMKTREQEATSNHTESKWIKANHQREAPGSYDTAGQVINKWGIIIGIKLHEWHRRTPALPINSTSELSGRSAASFRRDTGFQACWRFMPWAPRFRRNVQISSGWNRVPRHEFVCERFQSWVFGVKRIRFSCRLL